MPEINSKYIIFIVLVLCLFSPFGNRASAEPFLGEIMWVPYNFAPRGWAMCEGQVLPINQNQALYSLLGARYGGDGIITFALPNMRGRVMVNAGGGYTQGQSGGEETHTLTNNEMPAHNHTVRASSQPGDQTSPQSNVWAKSNSGKNYGSGPSASTLQTLGNAGSGQAHNNMMPYLTLNCVIALRGVYPNRP